MIPFNKPYLSGKELVYIKQALEKGKISGNGYFTKKCHEYFNNRYGFHHCLLTTSCTDALEMCAILLDISPGDEVIVPSYTFVSTANAFVLRGANIVFADSNKDNPNIDPDCISSLITPKTKAIVVVHYAGIACDMKAIMKIVADNNLYLIEDAAQAIESFYEDRPLGSFGHLATFSFHETKNIISGEGGLLVVNDKRLISRAEIIWEKGTNRAAFFRGEINKYGWVDVGSSFLPSELISAFLMAQLENLERIQNKRIQLWERYYENLSPLKAQITLPYIPDKATNNGHMFYILCKDLAERTKLIEFLKSHNILSVFHYLSLECSSFFSDKYTGPKLENSNRYEVQLLRLPLFYELTISDVDRISHLISEFYK